MRLYLGSRDFRPDGFLTVDIDPARKPDIVADVSDLRVLESSSADEICASHILEHLPWPVAYKALGEWARVLRPGGCLRVAVPDLQSLAAMIATGRNVWAAVAMVYGMGRLDTPFEAHQYGFSSGMLTSILRSLGFEDFDWWHHDLPDASNGWMFEEDGQRISLSLNLAAIKRKDPAISPDRVYQALLANRSRPFDQVLMELGDAPKVAQDGAVDALMVQRLHFQLIEARQRIKYLEDSQRAAPDGSVQR